MNKNIKDATTYFIGAFIIVLITILQWWRLFFYNKDIINNTIFISSNYICGIIMGIYLTNKGIENLSIKKEFKL